MMGKKSMLSSFGKWIESIDFSNLEKQVDTIHQDKYTKKLTTKSYLLLFLHAHLHEKESLRAISDAVLDEDFQKELGFDAISAAQLSRKNNEVDPSLLARVFVDLVQKIHHHGEGKKRTNRMLKIIDSSTIPLCLTDYKWARFSQTKAGVKLHLRLVFMENGTTFPEKATITPANVHDRTQLEVLVDEKEAMYVFDRGYVDYEAFDRFCDEGIFFASRLKKNAVIQTIETFPVAEESPIISDSKVVIGNAKNRTKNVFRLIKTVDTKGNIILIITNRFDLSAEEIGNIYRSRWAIELFFKWLKQHVRIKTFYGTSETAVQNQIYMALIAYCLLVLVQMETEATQPILRLKRWLQAVLWKPYEKWFRRIQYRSMRRRGDPAV